MVRRFMMEWDAARRQARGQGETAFRFRGTEVSRLEGFSDAVFGFAVTLLVLAVEVPHSFDQMLDMLRGTLVFVICFFFLFRTWCQQYIYFRRYGLNDGTTFRLTGVLLFLVLLYVYPLRFIFTLVLATLSHGLTLTTDLRAHAMIRAEQLPLLFLIYSTGYAALHLTFAALFLHAYRQREALELNEIEVFDTHEEMGDHLLNASFGLLSVLLSILCPLRWMFLAGVVYMGLGPGITLYKGICGKRRRALESRLRANREENSEAVAEASTVLAHGEPASGLVS